MATTIESVERGIFRRKDPTTGTVYAPLWIRYQHGTRTVMEPAGTTNLKEARIVRAQKIAAAATGTPVVARSLTVAELLEQLLAHHEVQGHAYLLTVRGHVKALTEVIGERRAKDFTSDDVTAMQQRWQAEGRITNTTINRRCSSLRMAFTLAKRKRLVADVPYIPLLPTTSPRGLYVKPGDQAALAEHLPDYVVRLLEFARLFSIRRGQLSRTLRTWVDRARAVIAWPPSETKSGEAHTIPLDEAGLAIVDQLLAEGEQRPWCPYLFHGPRCAPGRMPNRRYGCVGDFKHAWAVACRKAGLPVGRKQGGYVFHHLRNTAVTDMLASGKLSVTEVMAFSGHKTDGMVRHYNLGNVEALRERIAASRDEIERLQARGGR